MRNLSHISRQNREVKLNLVHMSRMQIGIVIYLKSRDCKVKRITKDDTCNYTVTLLQIEIHCLALGMVQWAE